MMFFASRVPCAACGASVERETADSHVCDPGRRLEFQVLAMGSAIAAFDDDLGAYLASSEGRFERWLAERDVRRSA